MEKEYITNAKVTNNEWIKLGRHTFQQPNNLVASLSPNSVTQNGITNGGHAYKAINPIDDDSTTQNTCSRTAMVLKNIIRRNMRTSQISTGWGGSSSRAIDGNTNSRYGSRSCTHTRKTNNPWWKVDLGKVYDNIHSVKLFNRGDCCGSRLSNVEVYITNNNILSASASTRCGSRISRVQQGKSASVNCGTSRSGRYIWVRLYKREWLTLCEVQVFQAQIPEDGAKQEAWWQVDLGSSKNVGEIVVRGGSGRYGQLSNGMYVHVTNTPYTTASAAALTSSSSSTQCMAGAQPFNGGNRHQRLICEGTNGKTGRYVIIRSPDAFANGMVLCDVKVYEHGKSQGRVSIHTEGANGIVAVDGVRFVTSNASQVSTCGDDEPATLSFANFIGGILTQDTNGNNNVQIDIDSKLTFDAIGSDMNLADKVKVMMSGGPTGSSLVNANAKKQPTYLGCYRDKGRRDLSGRTVFDDRTNNLKTCEARCAGYKYFSVQYGRDCHCGNSYGRYGKLPARRCKEKRCTGQKSRWCGGGWANMVYQINQPYTRQANNKIDFNKQYIGCYRDKRRRENGI